MKQAITNGKKLITIFSVLSILAVSILSVFIGAPITAVAETPQGAEVWAGYDADRTYNAMFQGSGTATDPYLIENGDQLWKMLNGYGIIGGGSARYDNASGKYYNGSNVEVFPAHYKLTKDIYLNDITNYSQWGTDGFDMSALNNWRGQSGIEGAFFGKLNGDGHTIYGLYANAATRAAFIPQTGKDASIKNLHFRNSYIVNTATYEINETNNWNILANGTASVLVSYCGSGDGNNNTVDIEIANCSFMDCYVEGKYFTSAILGYIDGAIPSIKNCIVADTELNSTVLGAKGAILNETWGGQNLATIEGVVSIGNPFYCVEYNKCWNGYKVPLVSFKYVFKDCYSDVKHTFSYKHSDLGDLSFNDTEITYMKPNRLVGEAPKDNLNLDWDNNWQTTEGYPIPKNEYIVPTGPDYYANGGPKSSFDMWNGKTAKTYAAGTGTVDDPYLIETCEQFYKMVSSLNTTDYFKIADGVEALYFNDVKDFTYDQTIDYLSQSKRAHIYNPGNNNFGGYFDGNGVTIYGVKAVAELNVGLFPKTNSSTIKNFTVKNSYFYAPDDKNSSTKVEGAAAVVGDLNSNAAVSLRNIAVIDCYINSPTRAAGLVACSHTGGAVFIDDCIVSGGMIMSDEGTSGTAAFVAGSNSGTHVIKNSISLDIYPAANNMQSYGSTFVNVYTDFDAPSSLVAEAVGEGTNVKKVATEALMSKAAKETAKEFDWTNSWKTMREEPMPLVHKAVMGTPGAAWSGGIADAYAGGTGSKSDPYQIDTPERLAQMIMYCKPGAYYELTADININDTTAADWQANAISWLTSADAFAFTGIFNGKGKIVSGLYYKEVAAGEYAGLIPVLGSGAQVSNLFIENSELNGAAGSTVGTVVGNVEDGSKNAVTLRACYVGDTVKLSGAGNMAGVVGSVGLTKLKMDNTLSAADMTGVTGAKAGLVGAVKGKLEIKQSISVGVYPFAAKDGVAATDIYTDTDSTLAVDGVIKVENANMIGEDAKTYLTALDFNEGGTWTTIANDYPHPTGNTKPFDGVPGEAWTGEVATQFAGGTGTPEDPYLIATGEQLALMLNSSDANGFINGNYKLVADIYLNDVYDPLWADLVGCQSWYSSHERAARFSGVFDGDGYGVFGMYYNNPSAPADTYMGLFPKLGRAAIVKNVAISHAYINGNVNEANAYVGGIFGMYDGNGDYSYYGKKASPADTANVDENGRYYLLDGATKHYLITVDSCIVDHTCHIQGGNAAGIGNGGGGAIVIKDCIVTSTLVVGEDKRVGALLGNTWAGGSRLYNSIAFPQNDVQSSGGSHQWVEDEASIVYYHENVYYYGSKYIYGTTNVPRPQWRLGEEAKAAMSALDWENVWMTVKDGTPIQRVFAQEGRLGEAFSDKTFNIPDVQINFITGDDTITVESLVGKPYEKVTLPTISRMGYIFTGWYSFQDITLEYPYDYFLSRDINLYAGWEKNGLIQDFEDYFYSTYDCDPERWNYNKPGSRGGYNFDYVHTGTKSLQLLPNSAEDADMLVNYEDWLTVDQDYTMTFWVATDKADTAVTLSLVQNNHPQIQDTAVSVDPMVTVTGLQVGEWKQYKYSFKAKTNWVSIRATGNSSLYIDDIVIAPTGTIVEDNNNFINGDLGGVSPNTADATAVAIAVSAIAACAIVFVITKKNFSEVIEKN